MINVPYDVLAEKIVEKAGISRSDLDSRVKVKLEQLSGLISKEGAAHIVANELGVNLMEAKGIIKIKSLISGMKKVDVAGKVMRKFDVREFSTQRGQGKLAKFVVADETGSLMVVMWNDKADLFQNFAEGDIIKVSSCTVRENNGKLEVHMADDSSVEVNPSGVSVNVAAKQGGDFSSGPAATRKKISELNENDANVEIFATVVQVFDPKYFEVDPSTGKRLKRDSGEIPADASFGVVLNIFVDDGSDNTRVVLWKNQILNLLGVAEDELMKFRSSPELFEKFKTDLLGMMAKFVGRVSKNDLFGRLEFVANRVLKDVDPDDEIKKVSEKAPSEPVVEKAAPVKESVSEDESEELAEDDLLSLDELEDLED